MMKKYLFVGAGALLLVACSGSAPETVSEAPAASSSSQKNQDPNAWQVNVADSALTFVATQNDKEFEGTFSAFDADIVFDPENLADASISVSIDMESATTGDRQRDSALPGNDWFKAKEFPRAQFTATSVTQTGPGQYEAVGLLAIRDITKEITLPFSLDIAGDTASADGSVTLIRTDFGVGQGEFTTGEWVGLEVMVGVQIKATR